MLIVRAVFIVVAAFVLAGCGGDRGSDAATKCSDRMVEGAVPTRVPESQLRQYLNATYCARFAREGWVYDDGALSIDAQWSLVRGGSEACAAELGGAPKVFPCRAVLGQGTLDCGLLHFVRRSEVRAYLGQLPGGPRGVRCDDGTPPAELGVP